MNKIFGMHQILYPQRILALKDIEHTFCTSVGSIGFLYSNSSPTLNDMSMGMMLDLKEKQWNGPSVLMHNMALLSAIILSASPDGAPVILLTMNKIMN